MKPKVLVLVHPAWHGAWFWKKVVPLLRERGHLVFTPTLTGLGERSHLAGPEIGLETHVNDVVNVLKYEDLREVVLVSQIARQSKWRTCSIWTPLCLKTVKPCSIS